MYKHYFKRFFDFWISLVAIICISPILIVVTIWLHFANKGAGAFFFQERPGKNCKIFKVIKYKTMTDERDDNGNLLPDDIRLTKFGKILRSTSLDELPELINIIKGDMSIVGPRPLLVEYLPYYTDSERERHFVLPGLTGYAQINGRSASSWEDKFSKDVKYVHHITFTTDLKIIAGTFFKVLKRSDILVGSEMPVKKLNI